MSEVVTAGLAQQSLVFDYMSRYRCLRSCTCVCPAVFVSICMYDIHYVYVCAFDVAPVRL